MTPDKVVEWSEALNKAGGWGIAAILFIVFGGVIIAQWREGKSKDERFFAVLDKTNDILKLLTPQTSATSAPAVQPKPAALLSAGGEKP